MSRFPGSGDAVRKLVTLCNWATMRWESLKHLICQFLLHFGWGFFFPFGLLNNQQWCSVSQHQAILLQPQKDISQKDSGAWGTRQSEYRNGIPEQWWLLGETERYAETLTASSVCERGLWEITIHFTEEYSQYKIESVSSWHQLSHRILWFAILHYYLKEGTGHLTSPGSTVTGTSVCIQGLLSLLMENSKAMGKTNHIA